MLITLTWSVHIVYMYQITLLHPINKHKYFMSSKAWRPATIAEASPMWCGHVQSVLIKGPNEVANDSMHPPFPWGGLWWADSQCRAAPAKECTKQRKDALAKPGPYYRFMSEGKKNIFSVSKTLVLGGMTHTRRQTNQSQDGKVTANIY